VQKLLWPTRYHSEDNNRLLAAINYGMDDPGVAGIGGASAFYGPVDTAQAQHQLARAAVT
jgi:hypothetical protein